MQLQVLDALMYASILAQADASSKWVAPALLALIVLIVVGIGWASRTSTGETNDRKEPPKVSDIMEPGAREQGPATTLEGSRNNLDMQEVEGILTKHPDTWTVRDRKIINLAKQADKGLSDRITAVEHTAASREEHANLEVQTDKPPGLNEFEAPAPHETPEPEPQTSAVSRLTKDGGEDASQQSEPEDDATTSMVDGLEKTRGGFAEKFAGLFKGKEEIDEDLHEHIEEFLYTSDIGTKAAARVMRAIDTKLRDDLKKDPKVVWEFVRAHLTDMLVEREGKLDLSAHTPFVILVIGVNGAGKTTTIGKMASQYKREGKSVLLVAGDTFRAAAVEQLEVWADRVDIPVHRGKDEADPASVVFSGIEHGVKEGFDVIICDTSGRLHTNANLMDELRKIERVSGKAHGGAPHETILVLDANTGQNAISQAKTFGEALGITGIILTKLDGTARGGVILGIGEELDVPVRYIGIGEGVKDLRHFDAEEFADALFL